MQFFLHTLSSSCGLSVSCLELCIFNLAVCLRLPINVHFLTCILFKGTVYPVCAQSAVKSQITNCLFVNCHFVNEAWKLKMSNPLFDLKSVRIGFCHYGQYFSLDLISQYLSIPNVRVTVYSCNCGK